MARSNIDLDGGQDQPGHSKSGVTAFAHGDEVVAGYSVANVNVTAARQLSFPSETHHVRELCSRDT